MFVTFDAFNICTYMPSMRVVCECIETQLMSVCEAQQRTRSSGSGNSTRKRIRRSRRRRKKWSETLPHMERSRDLISVSIKLKTKPEYIQFIHKRILYKNPPTWPTSQSIMKTTRDFFSPFGCCCCCCFCFTSSAWFIRMCDDRTKWTKGKKKVSRSRTLFDKTVRALIPRMIWCIVGFTAPSFDSLLGALTLDTTKKPKRMSKQKEKEKKTSKPQCPILFAVCQAKNKYHIIITQRLNTKQKEKY